MQPEIIQPAKGAYVSTPDYRDDIVMAGVAPELAKVELPSSYQSTLGPVLYQRLIPACVAHDITDLIKLWWFMEHGEWIDFSPRFLDILSAEAWIPIDGGRVPRTVLKVAAKVGICTTATLPNDTSLSIQAYRDKGAITKEAMAEAEKYKIPGYVRVAIDKIKTRQAIVRYGAVSTLFHIGEELWTPSWFEKDINPLKTPKGTVSGHQMGQKGWMDDAMNTLRNEWSAGWNRGGEGDFDYDAWIPYIFEQWAIAQVPKDVADFLKDLPKPGDFSYNWARDMKRGDFGEDVKFLQIAYMILGFMDPVTPDELGHFGPKTSAANLRYQRARRISPVAPDNAGPRTRAALNVDFAL